jgi:hypothetical protein
LKNISSGQSISIGVGIIKVLWPDANWIALNLLAISTSVLGKSEEKISI